MRFRNIDTLSLVAVAGSSQRREIFFRHGQQIGHWRHRMADDRADCDAVSGQVTADGMRAAAMLGQIGRAAEADLITEGIERSKQFVWGRHPDQTFLEIFEIHGLDAAAAEAFLRALHRGEL